MNIFTADVNCLIILLTDMNRLYSVARETPDSDNDAMCAELKKDEGWKKSVNNSRPVSISSEPEKKWVDIVSGNK